MFLSPKRIAIGLLMLSAGFLFTSDVFAQSSQYEARLQAMRAARNRAQQAQQAPSDEVQQTNYYDEGYEIVEPPVPRRAQATVARLPRQSERPTTFRAPQNTGQSQMRRPSAQNPNRVAKKMYTPQHLRTAQVYDGQIIDEGSPIASGSPIVSSGPVVMGNGCNCGSPGCASCSGQVYSEIVNDCGCGADCGVGCGVGGCGLNGLMCGRCYSCGPLNVPCSERMGCPPGTYEDCWLFGLGKIFANGDYFIGASSFKGPAFNVPGAGTQLSDSNYGLYGGVNLGLPLCKLTCGLFSAQVGARSVQSNFNGTLYSADRRDQTFLTAGIYRRVDYGLQLGVVADLLHEEWITESEVAQVRADIGWVYPSGGTLGFRFATNLDDDSSDGSLNETTFNGLVTSTYDQYRFYYRRDCEAGGFTDIFAGWADTNRAVLGIDVDSPIAEHVAIQAGLTYLIADETPGVGSTNADSWNLYMGLVFRPRGISWYRYYDRPLFDVADNGTFLIKR